MANPKHSETNKRTGARIYKHPKTGARLPSVTTVISGKNKPALLWWSAKEAAEMATLEYGQIFPPAKDDGTPGWASEEQRQAIVKVLRAAHTKVRDKAAKIGTQLHNVAENYALDQPLPKFDDLTLKYVSPMIHWIDTVEPKIIGTEVTVWHPRYRYAGTLDGLYEINGEVWLIDIKTGSAVYPETAIQLAALGNAPRRLTGGANPKPDHYGVLHVVPDSEDGPGRVVLHAMDDYIDVAWKAFRGLLMLHEFTRAENEMKKALQG